MNCDILHIKYEYDRDKLNDESKQINYKPVHVDHNIREKKVYDSFKKEEIGWWKTQETWKYSEKFSLDHIKNFSETSRIYHDFKNILKLTDEEIRIRFVTQKINTEAKSHVDATPASINFLIYGSATPIIFEDEREYFYEAALLNVSKAHSVPIQRKTDRLLLKMNLLTMSFETARERILNELL
ncbi:MAG: hypothetical protein RLZZ337_1521 [Bacteroidota bacterium]|jgi:hypothetical protein